MNTEILELCRLFFQAGIGLGGAFILGFALGLFVMGYLSRGKKPK